LIDELSVFLCPIIVGKGKRLFEGPVSQLALRLMDSRALKTGAVALTYVPEKA
jgi:dihydrofolate reductase